MRLEGRGDDSDPLGLTCKAGDCVLSVGYVQPTTATAKNQAISTERARSAAARRLNVTVTYRRLRGARGHLGLLVEGADAAIQRRLLPRVTLRAGLVLDCSCARSAHSGMPPLADQGGVGS